jgi:hypothetical protein
MCRYSRLCSPSAMRYILGKNQMHSVFHPEDEGDMFLRNVCSYKKHSALSHSRRQNTWSKLVVVMNLNQSVPSSLVCMDLRTHAHLCACVRVCVCTIIRFRGLSEYSGQCLTRYSAVHTKDSVDCMPVCLRLVP